MKTIKILFFALLCGLAIFSCHGKTEKNKPVLVVNKDVKKNPTSNRIIRILPLGDVHTEYINVVKMAVKNFYGYDCVVLPQKALTPDILAPSKTRYEASKILDKYNSNDYQLILIEKDIACQMKERHTNEWGIFGMGMLTGKTCVISTFRLKRNVSTELFYERLRKVSLHEIGHNLGLDHCTNNPHCMMNAANGTITQVDREKIWFCDKCMGQIRGK